MIVAMSPRRTRARRSSSSASVVSAPAVASSSRPPLSICQTSRSPGRPSRTSASVRACVGVSRMTATQSESPTIQLICSADEVS